MMIQPIQPGFVGLVTDVDICQPLTARQVAQIEGGMDSFAVLAFPNQPVTDEQQVTFSANFGELEIPLAAPP